MKSYLRIWITLMVMIFGCSPTPDTSPQTDHNLHIIPKPQKIERKQGFFVLSSTFSVGPPPLGSDKAISYLKSWLSRRLNLSLFEDSAAPNLVFITDEDLAREGYRLHIEKNQIKLSASDEAGFFYGIISLIQLVATNTSATTAMKQKIQIPCVTIEDEPTFAYRGMHLDVARHFFPVDFIKKYIDLLALYKFNRFHWHLTEDQGWRIEIKQYPKLQEIAAYRKETLVGHYSDQPHQFDGQPYGGYYTQEEIKAVVKYAEERCITIIPEIEMPGHSRAALAAYPELACSDGPFEVATKWGVFEEVYCPKEETFIFLENVLSEVMALFPGQYIHIGGDECPKTAWKNSRFCQQLMQEKGLKDENELQRYFINRIEKFLNQNGRQIIGWDEILEGGLTPHATVMSWRGERGGIEAAKAGHQVVMTPTSHCYFDYYQSDHPNEPLAIGGYLPLEKVYRYHPIPEELTEQEAQYILGAQANLWTEYIPTPQKAEYMAFPRAIALSEGVWSGKENKNFEDFINRLIPHFSWLKSMDVNFANRIYDVKSEIKKDHSKGLLLQLSNLAQKGEIKYALDTLPTIESPTYTAPIPITQSGIYQAQCYINGKAIGHSARIQFDLHKASAASIELVTPPSATYSAGGPNALVNGVMGADHKYGDKEWLGFSGDHCVAILDLGKPQPIKQIKLRFFNSRSQWIYPPKSISISIGPSDGQWSSKIEKRIVDSANQLITSIIPIDQEARYLKIEIENFGEIPQGRQGAGNKAWLFVDELVVE